MDLAFTPAVRHEAKARVALIGPTGAGKTHTALEIAAQLGTNVGVIDTENGSASLYGDEFTFQTAPWPPPYDAAKLAAAIRTVATQFDVLIIDSLTHFWSGNGGVLDVVDREAQRNRGNTFAAWKVGSPLWRGLLDALIFAPCHVIITMRSKMEYVQQRDENGKTKVEKLGMAPQARNDVEYEFTIVGEMDQAHRLVVTKSRCAPLTDQVAQPHQAAQIGQTLAAWLATAQPADTAPPAPLPPTDPTDPGEPDPNMITDAQITKLAICFREIGITDRGERVQFLSDAIGRTIASSKELTKDEASRIIDNLEAS